MSRSPTSLLKPVRNRGKYQMRRGLPRVFIIILNWNGKENTEECLQSVQKADYPNYEIVVVDNGSTDGSVGVLRKNHPGLTIIENPRNLGYAGGNNRGIAYCLERNADYVLILNNDTVVDPSFLTALIRTAQDHPEAGILGPKIYYYQEPNRIWSAGNEWLPDQADFVSPGYRIIDDGTQWQEVRQVGYVIGCALLVKAEAIKRIGLLEPKYFNCWEETEWCFRARKLGYQCLFVPHAKIWHKVSASFNGQGHSPHYLYFYYRNQLLWIERNLKFGQALKMYKHLLEQIFCEFRMSLNWKSGSLGRMRFRAILQGLWDYMFRRFGDGPSWLYAPLSPDPRMCKEDSWKKVTAETQELEHRS